MGKTPRALLPTMKMLLEGENQPNNAQKRIQEIPEKEEEDGISGLPDCLLLEILSRLPSTKDAIRTGTLSKRWAHLWTCVPTLIFAHYNHPYPWFSCKCLRKPNSIYDFARSVEKTLTQCRQLKLKKFELRTHYDIRFKSLFKNWIRHAISCNVEELNLEFMFPDEFWLDQSIFINSCFTDLKLVGCKLNPNGAISWKNLKSLYISYMKLDEDLIVNILSGSPLLETLVLEDLDDYTGIYTTSDDSSDDESEANIMKTNASYSLSLTQCPQLKLKKFKLLSNNDIKLKSQLNSWILYAIRCNVKEIYLILWTPEGIEYEFMLDQTLFTSSCFTHLTLHRCMVNPIGAISWKNLRNLCVSNGSLDEDLIKNILLGSPVLETLELEDCFGYKRLDITSKSVKKLVISGYKDFNIDRSEDDVIKINAPNIRSLTIQNEINLLKILLVDVSSLVKADLDYYICEGIWYNHTTPKEEMLKGFIMNLSHVKEIKIGLFCSKVVTCLQEKGFIFPSNVKFPQVEEVTESLTDWW
ncbi:unnamed protein product [Lactuca saligna]|uniref:F-box domain-containing protein n=1 Tax=Lactuca saligna TaxID=75948 RepID=A0AA35Z809_LACSI|nr:unnamed protein product [Lactuca saligna]